MGGGSAVGVASFTGVTVGGVMGEASLVGVGVFVVVGEAVGLGVTVLGEIRVGVGMLVASFTASVGVGKFTTVAGDVAHAVIKTVIKPTAMNSLDSIILASQILD